MDEFNSDDPYIYYCGQESLRRNAVAIMVNKTTIRNAVLGFTWEQDYWLDCSLSLWQLSNFTFTFHFHTLEKEMATHSSVLAWRIPGMGEPGARSNRYKGHLS